MSFPALKPGLAIGKGAALVSSILLVGCYLYDRSGGSMLSPIFPRRDSAETSDP
jgi:hypothetical protein